MLCGVQMLGFQGGGSNQHECANHRVYGVCIMTETGVYTCTRTIRHETPNERCVTDLHLNDFLLSLCRLISETNKRTNRRHPRDVCLVCFVSVLRADQNVRYFTIERHDLYIYDEEDVPHQMRLV